MTAETGHAAYTTVEAEYLRGLLHLFHAVLQRNGKYAGLRRVISTADMAAHLNGTTTFAFCVSTKYETGSKPLARFVAFDVDKRFSERLPVLSTTLGDLGIAQAAFATSGSSVDKGKVIITLSKMVRREEAIALAHLVYSQAHRRSPELIPERPRAGDIELFPRKPTSVAKDTGILRILGRNAGRNGPLETPLDLEGRPMDLRQVKPLAQSRLSRLARPLMLAQRARNRPEWVDGSLMRPWTSLGGVKRMRSKMTALARYFLTALGPKDGRAAYVDALTQIKAHSPGLDIPSPNHRDGRNPVCREILELGAWRAAVRNGVWEPREFDVIITRPRSPFVCNDSPGGFLELDAPDGAKRVYAAMARHVRTNGLWPHCFGIDQRTLAAMLCISQPACGKAIDLAERYGLIVCLHPGTSNSAEEHGADDSGRRRRRVRPGVTAMYGLVGKGENVFDVFADARQDAHLKERRRRCPVQSIMPETFAIVGRLVVEAARGHLSALRPDCQVA